MEITPRESVILAADFASLVEWYAGALGFAVTKRFEGKFHYCNLETAGGVRIGIAPAAEMGVTPDNRSANTVVLQFRVPDVKAFLEHVRDQGGTITGGPSFDPSDSFWFGSFADPEGNPFWVVDENCP
ncbi:VOC family protein [bacterium]|nr:VOC family protein [bacterium]